MGHTLTAGQFLENAQYRLYLQGDGNLVEYVGGRALWSSGTAGHEGAWMAMQGDGNVVVYSASGEALWSSGTAGNPGAYLGLQPDANVVVYSASNTPLWASGTTNSSLGAGETLTAGEYLLSGDRHFELVMQGDGNLVEYVSGRPLWSSVTPGNEGAWAVMQSDGNVVVYTAAGKALWSSGTPGNAGAYLAVQPDANLVVYAAGIPIWASHSFDNELRPGEVLQPSQYLTSGNGYEFVMQNDGNLVLYSPSAALWSSGTPGNAGAYAGLQGTDGNFVVYDAGKALWASNTAGNAGDHLAVQSDGNVVMYSSGGTPVWSTNTAGGNPGGSTGERILAEAEKWSGTPYCWAGGNQYEPTLGTRDPENGLFCGIGGYDHSNTPGFDCTGLTMYAVYQATRDVLVHDGYQGREAIARYHPQVITNPAALQPGDVVYFHGSVSGYVSHAGIYVGGGEFISAVTEGLGVRLETLAWEGGFAGALRF